MLRSILRAPVAYARFCTLIGNDAVGAVSASRQRLRTRKLHLLRRRHFHASTRTDCATHKTASLTPQFGPTAAGGVWPPPPLVEFAAKHPDGGGNGGLYEPDDDLPERLLELNRALRLDKFSYGSDSNMRIREYVDIERFGQSVMSTFLQQSLAGELQWGLTKSHGLQCLAVRFDAATNETILFVTDDPAATLESTREDLGPAGIAQTPEILMTEPNAHTGEAQPDDPFFDVEGNLYRGRHDGGHTEAATVSGTSPESFVHPLAGSGGGSRVHDGHDEVDAEMDAIKHAFWLLNTYDMCIIGVIMAQTMSLMMERGTIFTFTTDAHGGSVHVPCTMTDLAAARRTSVKQPPVDALPLRRRNICALSAQFGYVDPSTFSKVRLVRTLPDDYDLLDEVLTHYDVYGALPALRRLDADGEMVTTSAAFDGAAADVDVDGDERAQRLTRCGRHGIDRASPLARGHWDTLYMHARDRTSPAAAAATAAAASPSDVDDEDNTSADATATPFEHTWLTFSTDDGRVYELDPAAAQFGRYVYPRRVVSSKEKQEIIRRAKAAGKTVQMEAAAAGETTTGDNDVDDAEDVDEYDGFRIAEESLGPEQAPAPARRAMTISPHTSHSDSKVESESNNNDRSSSVSSFSSSVDRGSDRGDVADFDEVVDDADDLIAVPHTHSALSKMRVKELTVLCQQSDVNLYVAKTETTPRRKRRKAELVDALSAHYTEQQQLLIAQRRQLRQQQQQQQQSSGHQGTPMTEREILSAAAVGAKVQAQVAAASANVRSDHPSVIDGEYISDDDFAQMMDIRDADLAADLQRAEAAGHTSGVIEIETDGDNKGNATVDSDADDDDDIDENGVQKRVHIMGPDDDVSSLYPKTPKSAPLFTDSQFMPVPRIVPWRQDALYAQPLLMCAPEHHLIGSSLELLIKPENDDDGVHSDLVPDQQGIPLGLGIEQKRAFAVLNTIGVCENYGVPYETVLAMLKRYNVKHGLVNL